MPACKAIGCRHVTGRAPQGVRFYRVPRDKAIATEWLVKCGVKTDNDDVFRNALVCSEHFLPDDFEDDMQYRLGFKKTFHPKVKDGRVPSVFNHPLAKPVHARASSIRRAKEKVNILM